MLKPSVGFCSMGVHAVHDRDDWQRALSDIAQNASAWHDLYPESVVGTGSFMLEGYLEGTEYALDAYFDETGAAHVLDVLRHDFAGPCRHERPPLRDERPLSCAITRPCSNRGSTA